ncbi:hypothetical protein D3C81_1120060 [compost metagenome]
MVVQPGLQIGAVHIQRERAFDMHLLAPRPPGMPTIADVAGDQFGDELGNTLAQRLAQHCRPRVACFVLAHAGLLDMHVLMRDHVHEAVLRVGVHEICRAQRFQADYHPVRMRHAHRLAAPHHDRHRRELRLRVDRLQVGEHLHQSLPHRRQLRKAGPSIGIHRRVARHRVGHALGGHPAQLRELGQARRALCQILLQLGRAGLAAGRLVQRVETGGIGGQDFRSRRSRLGSADHPAKGQGKQATQQHEHGSVLGGVHAKRAIYHRASACAAVSCNALPCCARLAASGCHGSKGKTG